MITPLGLPIELFITIGAFILLLGILFLFQGPPYVPSDDDSVEQMIDVIETYKPKRILDMGSGDGKLVIALAKKRYRVDGVELNPLLVYRSRKAVKEATLQNKVIIKWGNFWKYDTSEYDLIVLYVIKHIMPKLEKKLQKELKPGTIVVSNFFIFPNLQPIKTTDRVRVYKI